MKSWKVKFFSSKIFFPLFRARVPQFARRRFAAFSFAHLRAYLSIAFRTFVWYIEEIIFDESLDEEDENYYNGSYDDNRNDNNPQDNRPDGGTGCLGIVSAIVIMILLLSLLL